MAARARAEGNIEHEDPQPVTQPQGPSRGHMALPPVDRQVSFARRGAPGTSTVAAKTTLPKTGTRRQDIIEHIAEHGPATDDAIEQALDVSHQSISAARRGLVIDRYLEDRHEACHPGCPDRDEHRRPTRYHNDATVWHLTESAARLLSLRGPSVPEQTIVGR